MSLFFFGLACAVLNYKVTLFGQPKGVGDISTLGMTASIMILVNITAWARIFENLDVNKVNILEKLSEKERAK